MTEMQADGFEGDPAITGVPRASSGHAVIDVALERLDSLDTLEISQHPDEFDAIHAVLREALASAARDGDAPENP